MLRILFRMPPPEMDGSVNITTGHFPLWMHKALNSIRLSCTMPETPPKQVREEGNLSEVGHERRLDLGKNRLTQTKSLQSATHPNGLSKFSKRSYVLEP